MTPAETVLHALVPVSSPSSTLSSSSDAPEPPTRVGRVGTSPHQIADSTEMALAAYEQCEYELLLERHKRSVDYRLGRTYAVAPPSTSAAAQRRPAAAAAAAASRASVAAEFATKIDAALKRKRDHSLGYGEWAATAGAVAAAAAAAAPLVARTSRWTPAAAPMAGQTR
jgi:hypothetical protein